MPLGTRRSCSSPAHWISLLLHSSPSLTRLSARLGEVDGCFTGELTATPPTGEARALLMEQWAASFGLDLSHTVAYADSTSDLPMLEAAGYPVAVNPEPKLSAIARRRGWTIERWERAPGGPRNMLAIATRRRGPRTTPPATRSLGGVGAMKAILIERSLPRFAAARRRIARQWLWKWCAVWSTSFRGTR